MGLQMWPGWGRTPGTLARLGAERAAEFIGRYPDEAPRSLSMEDIGLDTLDAAEPAVEEDPAQGPEDNGRDGSNNWVLSGERTVSGLPILANEGM